MNGVRVVLIVAALVSAALFDLPAAHAQNAVVVAKGVQTGTVTFGNGSADFQLVSGAYIATVTLGTPVDSTKAFIHCTFSTRISNRADVIPTCELSNTTVTIRVAATTAANPLNVAAFTTVRWHVAEFEGDNTFSTMVLVQRGVATFSTSDTQPGGATITLPTAVDCTKSFVLTTARMNSTANDVDERWTVSATLGSTASVCTSGTTTSLELRRNESTTALTVAWQVVMIEGLSVQRGQACIGPTGTGSCTPGPSGTLLGAPHSGLVQGRSQGATLGTAVDTSKAFVLTTQRGGTAVAGLDGLYTARVEFSCNGTTASTTCLRFDRGTADTGANQQLQITWEVVSLQDLGRVVRNAVGSPLSTGASTTNINSASFTTVIQARTIPFFSRNNDRVSNASDLSSVMLTARVNETTLTFDRTGGGTRTQTVAWQAVEFFGCGADRTLCHVSVSAVSDTSADSAQIRVAWWPIYYANGAQCFAAGTASTTPLSPSTCNALVVRTVGTNETPITWTPSDGVSYTPGTFGTAGGSCSKTQGAATNPCIVSAPSASTSPTVQSVTETSMPYGNQYNYRVYVRTGAFSWATVADATGTLTQAPVTPIQLTATGGQKWVYKATGGAVLNSPIEDFAFRVYATSTSNKIITINSLTGAELNDPVMTPGTALGYPSWWPPAPPLTIGAQVVVGDQNGYLTSFDGTTGKRLWTRKIHTDPGMTSQGNIQAAIVVQSRQFSDPTFQNWYTNNYGFSGDVIFAGSRNVDTTDPLPPNLTINQENKVYALRADTGKSLWTFWPAGDSTNCSNLDAMDIIVGTPFVDYYTNRLYVATNDGPTSGKTSLWVVNTMGPAFSGAPTQNCRGMKPATYSGLNDVDTSIWESYDGSTFYFQSNQGDLYAYRTSGTTSLRINGTKVTGSANPSNNMKFSVWQDYYYTRPSDPNFLTRLYIVTQDGGVWCVEDLGNSFDVCPTDEWPDNPVYQNLDGNGATSVSAGMLLEPNFWVGGGSKTAAPHQGRGVLFQYDTATGSLVKTFPVGGSCTGSGASADCGVTIGDLSTSVQADALYFGTSAGHLYRINLSGSYGSLP